MKKNQDKKKQGKWLWKVRVCVIQLDMQYESERNATKHY